MKFPPSRLFSSIPLQCSAVFIAATVIHEVILQLSNTLLLIISEEMYSLASSLILSIFCREHVLCEQVYERRTAVVKESEKEKWSMLSLQYMTEKSDRTQSFYINLLGDLTANSKNMAHCTTFISSSYYI